MNKRSHRYIKHLKDDLLLLQNKIDDFAESIDNNDGLSRKKIGEVCDQLDNMILYAGFIEDAIPTGKKPSLPSASWITKYPVWLLIISWGLTAAALYTLIFLV